MKQISSVDLYFLTKELKVLENQRIETFYYENDTFYIKVYVKGKGNLFLTNRISQYIYLGSEKEDGSHPKSFIQYLRKYLKNSFITSVEQIEGERILKLELSKKEGEEFETYFIFIELFANANIILTDKDLMIKNTLKRKKFKDRKLVAKEEYKLPPAKELSISTLDLKLIKETLSKSDLSIVKFIATSFGTGGKFAEEICFRADFDKNKPSKDITNDEINLLIKTIQTLREEKIQASLVLNEQEEIVDFIPIEFKSLSKKKTQLDSFNDVLKSYFSQFKEKIDAKEKDFKNELSRLEKRLKSQEEQKNHINKEYEKLNSIGNKVYENYTTVEELLTSINKAAKEKGWDHVKEVIDSNENLSKLVKKLKYKNNQIIVNLE